jgi:hypothetical protein
MSARAVAVCLATLLGAGACDDSSGGGAGTPVATPRGGIAAADVPPAPEPALPQTRPAGAAPYTWHDYYKEALAFNRWTLVGAYRNDGTHGAWDAAAERFLDRLATHLTASEVATTYRPAKYPAQKELIAEAGALVAGGCTDPLVRYYNAALRHDAGDAAAAGLLPQACVDMLESGYPAYRRFAALRRGRRLKDPHPKFRSKEHELLPKLVAGPLSNIERRKVLDVLCEFLEPAYPADRTAQIAGDLAKAPGADPWVTDVLAGRAQIHDAWGWRGSGWAHTVTPGGWEGFSKHLTLARDHLTRAWKLAPELPEAPTDMITVAKGDGGQPGEDAMTWFKRVEQAQLDFRYAYDVMMGGPLLPRWGGTHAAVYALGQHAARSGRFDTDLPREALDAVAIIAKDSGRSWAFLSQPGVYEELARVLDAYAAHPGRHKPLVERDRLLRGAIGWRTGRFDDARRTLDAAGDRAQAADLAFWFSKSPQVAIGHVYAITGPEAARVKRGEAAMQAGHWEAALGEFRAAATALAGDEVTLPYLESRVALAERRVRLARGEWTDVRPPHEMAGWREVDGEWSVTPDKAITLEPYDPIPSILLDENLGASYEFAGKVKRVGGGSRYAGVALAAGDLPLAYVMFTDNGIELMSGEWTVLHRARAAVREDVAFACRFEGRALSVTVDGVPSIIGLALPPEFKSDPHVGLAAGPKDGARFTELQARRLVDGDAAAPAAPRAARE